MHTILSSYLLYYIAAHFGSICGDTLSDVRYTNSPWSHNSTHLKTGASCTLDLGSLPFQARTLKVCIGFYSTDAIEVVVNTHNKLNPITMCLNKFHSRI